MNAKNVFNRNVFLNEILINIKLQKCSHKSRKICENNLYIYYN